MRENIQNAFENLKPEFVRELGELYKNRVGERAAKGKESPRVYALYDVCWHVMV